MQRSPATTLLLASAVFLTTACAPPDMSDAAPTDFFLGGIQIHEANLEGWFDALEAQRMNTVHVTVYATQGDWDSDRLTWEAEVPRAVAEIRGAKRRGLAVVFVCRVALDPAVERNAFLWHGMIMPKTEALLESWFETYGRFVTAWAEIAEREGVDVFMIGSELNALATTVAATAPPTLEEYYLNPDKQEARRRQILAEQSLVEEQHLELRDHEGFDSVESYVDARIASERAWAATVTGGDAAALETVNRRRSRLQAHWEALVAKVRRVYSGQVGYAANFDQYPDVGFWPALDVMGMSAYFELRDQVLPDESEEHLYPLLVDGWRGVLGSIAAVREGQGLTQPLIFTEMGYTYRAKSTLRPWADEGFSLIHNRNPASGEPAEYVIVWRDHPLRFEERAWAVRALWQAHSELERPFLRGILYWKLSSHDYHFDDEAFMVHIGPGSDDPILPELRRFLG